jgi:hypothetical protein
MFAQPAVPQARFEVESEPSPNSLLERSGSLTLTPKCESGKWEIWRICNPRFRDGTFGG